MTQARLDPGRGDSDKIHLPSTHTHTHTHTQGGYPTPATTTLFLPSNPRIGVKRICLFAAAEMIGQRAQELHTWAL